MTNESGRSSPVPAGWRERFAGAYDTELQVWIGDIAEGREASGPSSWDGYAATVVADACITALHRGGQPGAGQPGGGQPGGAAASVSLRDRPDLYR